MGERAPVARSLEGCRCDICPMSRLEDVGPVPGDWVPGAALAVVAQAPGGLEVREGRPLVGPSGQVFDRALKAAGIDRRAITVTNTVLCQFPRNDYEDYMRALREENERRRSRGEGQWPSPLDCCRPRLLRELGGARMVVPLGGVALKAVVGQDSISRWQGSPILAEPPGPDGPGAMIDRPGGLGRPAGTIWVLPTYHPAYTMREGLGRRFDSLIPFDFRRAARILRDDRTRWFEDDLRLEPVLETALESIGEARTAGLAAVDIETDDKNPLRADVTCVGFAWNKAGGLGRDPRLDAACVLPFALADGGRYWRLENEERVRAALRALLEGSAVVKVFHNHLFDVEVLERQGFGRVGPVEDTMYKHHAAVSEFPHSLAFLARVYADDARYWKDDVKEGAEFEPPSDDVLWRYNARDCLATLRANRGLERGVVP